MKKMRARDQKWLKCFHVIFAGIWVGAGACLTLKQFFIHPTDGMALYGTTSTLKFIDDFVIIPAAVGCLLTAFIYSIWTKWGWFKHNWITVKWGINIFGVLFGSFFLGPWLNALPPLAKTQGLAAINDATFVHNTKMLLIFGTFQAATLIFACFLSVLKPWKKRESTT